MAKFYKFSILFVIALAALSSGLDYNVLPPELSDGLLLQDFAYDMKIINEHSDGLYHTLYFSTHNVAIKPEYRFHISIEREYEILCSGAAIKYYDRKFVITAASCGVKNADLVRVNAGKALEGGNIYRVKCVVNHPSYRVPGANLFDNDISIVYIEEDFTEKVLDLASSAVVPTEAKTTAYAQFSTKEFKNSLVVSNVKIYSHKECEDFGYEMTNNMLCAGPFALNTSFCNVDHGSPLFNDNGLLLGIKSWDEQCSQMALPTIYTKISEMYSWIVSTIRKQPQC